MDIFFQIASEAIQQAVPFHAPRCCNAPTTQALWTTQVRKRPLRTQEIATRLFRLQYKRQHLLTGIQLTRGPQAHRVKYTHEKMLFANLAMRMACSGITSFCWICLA